MPYSAPLYAHNKLFAGFDLFFELLMLVALMLFFMAFAQVVSRVNNKDADWKLIGFGLPAALLCLLCFVPRMAMVILGKGSVLAMLSPPNIATLPWVFLYPRLFSVKCVFSRAREGKIELFDKALFSAPCSMPPNRWQSFI